MQNKLTYLLQPWCQVCEQYPKPIFYLANRKKTLYIVFQQGGEFSLHILKVILTEIACCQAKDMFGDCYPSRDAAVWGLASWSIRKKQTLYILLPNMYNRPQKEALLQKYVSINISF
jgi:hypothetical protein